MIQVLVRWNDGLGVIQVYFSKMYFWDNFIPGVEAAEVSEVNVSDLTSTTLSWWADVICGVTRGM